MPYPPHRLKEGRTATPEEITEYCKTKPAKYKVPRKIEFRKELPKSAIGKVLRRVLVEEENTAQKGGSGEICFALSDAR